MGAMRLAMLFISLALCPHRCSSFNIEQQEARIIQLYGEESFGHRVEVLTSTENWIIVAAPLAMNVAGVRTGRIYRCLFADGSCRALDVPPPGNSTSIALGLSLSISQGNAPRILACGPNLAHRCGLNMYLNGVCFLFDHRFEVIGRYPPKIQDCFTAQVDLVFVIDGSGSIAPKDFSRMKEFLIAMLRRFKDRDVQFAVLQYSHLIKKEFSFFDYDFENKKEDLVRRIRQIKGDTFTPTAIKRAVLDLFGKTGGSRIGSSRAMVIVTDGKSNDDQTSFEDAVGIAENERVFRIAVGVGSDFQTSDGMMELSKIASKGENIFSILNYDALGTIEDKLQNKIFSIEGTKGNSSLFEREMGQEGFSCLLTSESVVLGSVGAFGWRGGVIVYRGGGETFLNLSDSGSKDSYLGYSLQAVERSENIYYISGAPRYRHRGEVVVFRTGSQSDSWDVIQRIPGEQIGANFGAEMSLLDLTGDGTRDLLLVAAPMFSSEDREGMVYVYRMSDEGLFTATTTLTGSPLRGRARFGSAVSPLGDLDGDGLCDVAVGAPLEEGGRGAVYIFSGTPSSIRKHHSLRLSGTAVSTPLRYFGQSVSGSRDVSGDGLSDLLVGSEGAVHVFRSRPVLKVVTRFTFDPPQVPPTLYPCPQIFSPLHLISSAFCVNLTWDRTVAATLGHPRVNISCTLHLDPHLPTSRATFQTSRDRLDEEFHVSGAGGCLAFQILVPNCIENYVLPILVQIDLRILPEGIANSDGLVPIVDQNFKPSQFAEILFERECILGEMCPDYLVVSFNFTGGDVFVIGTQEVLRVGVSVENRGDDAINVRLEFRFPPTLKFKRIVAEQAAIFPVDCESDDRTRGAATILNCRLNQLIFHEGSRLKFGAEFDADIRSEDEQNINLTIQCTSQTPHRITNSSRFTRSLTILHAIDVSIAQSNFTRHVTFTEGQDERHFVSHSYLVTNLGQTPIPMSVKIVVFSGSRTAPLWNMTVGQRESDSTNCRPLVLYQNSTRRFGNHDLLTDCGISLCVAVTCRVEASRPGTPLVFEVEGEVMEGAVREGKWRHLWTIAEIHFDKRRFAERSPNSAQFRKATTVTDIEFLQQPSHLPWILGGSLVGLLLLSISVFALYKVGFFKRSSTQDDGE